MVKVKFKCDNIQLDAVNEDKKYVGFSVVADEENSGMLSLAIDKGAAAYEAFEEGKEYYLTFEEA